MTADDVPHVARVAAWVHPAYPERLEVFAERLRLSPHGCRVLANAVGAVVGYVISHPWRGDAPPALDTLLTALPHDADTFYIHDIALLPEARGCGAAAACIAALADVARRAGHATMSLVAIAGTRGFWEGQGFRAVDAPNLVAKLKSYDASAVLMRRAIV